MVSAVAQSIGHSWAHEGRSIRIDVVCFLAALALHVPLYFMKIDASKATVDRPTERLISVDLLESMAPKPVQVAAPPAPAKPNLMDKLRMLVKREPPPPPVVPPKPVVQDKPIDVPKPIALAPKLDTPPPVSKTLESKAGFKTNADPKLIEEKQLALNTAPVGIAPLSAKKLGAIDDRTIVKKDRGNFQVSQKEQLSGIDDSPALAGAAAAPAIAIRTGRSASVEKFSAPVTQKSDKGRIGAVPSTGLDPQLGLRDRIIARDAAPNQIAGVGGNTNGAGLIPPPSTKRDAGRFQGGIPGSAGVTPGAAVGTVAAPIAAIPAKPREKKSMFTITGPLKDRDIVSQVTPEYPAWAQAQGIEAAVVLEFTVESSGQVKPNVIVRRTSGYPKLDETAIKALRQWKFAPLSDANRNEVGLITFNYTLS